MAGLIDNQPWQYQPDGIGRGLSHLSDALDSVLARRQAEELQARQLKQQRDLAAIDDARLQQQADQTWAHQQAEEERLRAHDQQESADKASSRGLAAAPHVQAALDSGDEGAARMFGKFGGIDVSPQMEAPPSGKEEVDRLLTPPAAQAPEPQPLGIGAMGAPVDMLAALRMRQPTSPPPQGQPAPEDDPLANMPPVGQAPPVMPAMVPPPPKPTGRYSLTMPGQDPIEYDPQAQRRRAVERGGQLATDLAPIGEGATSPYDQRALQTVQAMAKTGAFKTPDEALKARTDLAKFYELQAEENRRASINASGKVAAFSKPDTGRRLDLNSLRSEMKDWRQTSQWSKLQQGGFALRGAMANLEAEGPNAALQHKDAQIQLAKYFRGNVPTDSEMHMLYENLGGTLGNGLPKFFARMESGDLTPTELNMLRESMRTAHDEYKRNVKMAYESARATFGPGSGYENMATNVNTMLGGAFKNMGVGMDELGGDIYPEANTGVTLKGGAGARPAATAPSARAMGLAEKMRAQHGR